VQGKADPLLSYSILIENRNGPGSDPPVFAVGLKHAMFNAVGLSALQGGGPARQHGWTVLNVNKIQPTVAEKLLSEVCPIMNLGDAAAGAGGPYDCLGRLDGLGQSIEAVLVDFQLPYRLVVVRDIEHESCDFG